MTTDDELGLIVRLHDLVVGKIELRGNTVLFTPDSHYARSYPRAILGQVFEDNPTRVRSTHNRLAPWFSNLLPEKGGPLRNIVARQFDVHPDREFFLLAGLGHDLPGAVTVAPERQAGELQDQLISSPPSEVSGKGDVQLRFSLAGVQLKLSMLRDQRGLTLPASGEGGDWIAKLPFHEFTSVPENEYSMMTWISESGIDVPKIDLVSSDSVHGVPAGLIEPRTKIYVIRRFDRTPTGRIHIEDFAQILDVYPEEKYQHANYESIGRILLNVAGHEAVEELVRRLVAIVLIGNGDAHLKNWSLIYNQYQEARISPAYDFVSTVVYGPFHADTLALNLDRSKDFASVTPSSFRRFGERIGYPRPESLEELAAAFAAQMRAKWSLLSKELPLSEQMIRHIETRLKSLPLAKT